MAPGAGCRSLDGQGPALGLKGNWPDSEDSRLYARTDERVGEPQRNQFGGAAVRPGIEEIGLVLFIFQRGTEKRTRSVGKREGEWNRQGGTMTVDRISNSPEPPYEEF